MFGAAARQAAGWADFARADAQTFGKRFHSGAAGFQKGLPQDETAGMRVRAGLMVVERDVQGGGNGVQFVVSQFGP